MGEWKEYKLGDIAEIVCGATPSTHVSDYWKDEIKWVTAKDISESNGYKIYETERKISKRGFEKCSTKMLPINTTVLIARGATMGKCCMIAESMALNQTCYALIAKQDYIHSYYLFYLIKSLESYFNNISHGAIFNTVIGSSLKETSVYIPDVIEQKSIASILSSLDGKIDLLHRQNQTLEALAETLFRQWFVEVNESLVITKLKNFCNHLKANVNPLKQPDKIFHHYSIPAFDEGQEPEIALGREIRSNKYQVREGTLLISKLNPRFPRIWPILEKIEENHSICSTEFQVVKPKDTRYFGFILCFLKSKTVKDELIQSTGGTSGSHQRVSPEDIFNLTIPVPNDDKLKEFSLITNTYWDKIKNNKRQINTLARLRDTLLPKLMSGEVRVKDTESIERRV